jgi:hypothetical protein
MTKSTRFVSEEPFGPENGLRFYLDCKHNGAGLYTKSVFCRGYFSRKGAKRCRVFGGFLCVFAPLRLCARNILASDAP